MALFLRLLILGALAYAGWALFHEVRVAQSAQGGDFASDPSTVIACFAGVVIVAVIAGVLLAFSIIPMLGDLMGNALFTGGGAIERDPHAEAASLCAQGDYDGALAAYQALAQKDPADPQPISEMAKIYCEYLGSPQLAAEVLENALAGEHPAAEGAFLASRLADVYWEHLHDAARARHILIQIAEGLPDTKYAANARHRLQEIDRALAGEA